MPSYRSRQGDTVDLIACEDTRVTSKLTRHYGIATPLTAYHDHNAARARPRLLVALGEGRAVALVSDAGTPLTSPNDAMNEPTPASIASLNGPPKALAPRVPCAVAVVTMGSSSNSEGEQPTAQALRLAWSG